MEEERTTKKKGENPERKREGQKVEREDKRKDNSKRLKSIFPQSLLATFPCSLKPG